MHRNVLLYQELYLLKFQSKLVIPSLKILPSLNFIILHVISNMYELCFQWNLKSFSQWKSMVTKTVWLPAVFYLCSTEHIQVWNYMRVLKWWRYFLWTIPLMDLHTKIAFCDGLTVNSIWTTRKHFLSYSWKPLVNYSSWNINNR